MTRASRLHIRPATPDDRGRVEALVASARWRHQHLDWENSLDLLDRSPFLLAVEQGMAQGCLASPEDPSGVAWLRLFAVHPTATLPDLWQSLWREAVDVLIGRASTAAAISAQDWMQQSLAEAAFEETNAVLFLEWSGDPPKLEPPSDIEIRTLTRGDLKDVLALDERAFLPLWQLSFPALEAALEHSDVATAAYQGSRVPVGYALSTTSPLGGHLARLAVDPPHQGAGVGSALLAHTLDKLRSGGVQTVSVNTQADNQRGLDLYRKFGFEETGQVYPVFTRALPTIPRQWAGA